MQSCFETWHWYRTRVIKMITFLMHILLFNIINYSFSQLPIDNTSDIFICPVQRSKMAPELYTVEYEKWHAIGMLEAGQSQNSIARHFGKSIRQILNPNHF